MRIATVQTHDGAKLAAEVDGEYRRIHFDGDLLSLLCAGGMGLRVLHGSTARSRGR